MTLLDIKKYIGRKCALLNSSGAYVDGLVSEADLEELINIRYKELFMEMSEKYPFEYEVDAHIDLVDNQSEYTFGGDMTDAFEIRYVGVKYASTDTVFTRARRIDRSTAFEYDTDDSAFTVGSPRYYLTTIKYTADDKLYKGLRLLPTPTDDIAGGLYIRYVEVPQEMDEDTDEPYNLPSPARSLLGDMVVADVWEIKGDWARSDKSLNRFLYKKDEFFKSYQPLASDEPVITRNKRNFNPNIRTR